MNESLWILSSKGKSYESLKEDIKTDILIVGGGIVGVTTAYLLSKKGIEITLVDSNKLGYGCSGRNTGKITSQHNIVFSKIEKSHGLDIAKAYYEANERALAFIECLIEKNNIQCDYKRATSYILAQDEPSMKTLKEEEEIYKKLGIDYEYHDYLDLPFSIEGALAFKNQGKFNPKKYIDGMVEILHKKGVRIYENTPIVDLKNGEICRAKTKDGNIIRASKVIISSHTPWYDGMEFYFAKQKAERSYIVCGEYQGKFQEGMFISIEEQGKSINLYETEGRKMILIGGGKHKVGQGKEDKEYYEILKEFARKNFGVKDFEYQWSAQDYIPSDHVPYIGYLNLDYNNVYVATGFAKWGMSNGTVAAMVLSDMITSNLSEKDNIFSIDRKGVINYEFIKENINMAFEYIKSKITTGDKNFPENPGEGKVVTVDASKYGAYIDEDKNLYLVDVTCTHLGCELKFNKEEKTWDCPCHGSRFDYKGNVLEGPATNPLKSYGRGANDIDPHIVSINKKKREC